MQPAVGGVDVVTLPSIEFGSTRSQTARTKQVDDVPQA
jgi:hypothetical protein